MDKTIYDLDLHEHIDLGGGRRVTKVPDGWIYDYVEITQTDGSVAYGVFVPDSRVRELPGLVRG